MAAQDRDRARELADETMARAIADKAAAPPFGAPLKLRAPESLTKDYRTLRKQGLSMSEALDQLNIKKPQKPDWPPTGPPN